MAQIIKLRRSSVAGNVPTTTQLGLGELAINTSDGKIYFEKNDGSATVQTIVTTNSNAPITGSLSLSGSIHLTGSQYIKDGSLEVAGNVSGSSTSTGSFGAILADNINTSRLGGKSPLIIEADNFNVSATGNFSGSAASTGSFGRLIIDGGVDKVGIGSSSPTVNLDMPIAGGRARFGNGTVGVTSNVDIIANGGHTNAFGVWDDNSLSTPRFVVERTGKVGVGKDPQWGILDVAGNIQALGIGVYQTGSFHWDMNSSGASEIFMTNKDSGNFKLRIHGDISGSAASTGSFGNLDLKAGGRIYIPGPGGGAFQIYTSGDQSYLYFNNTLNMNNTLKVPSIKVNSLVTYGNSKDALTVTEGYTGGIRWGYVNIKSNTSNTLGTALAQLGVAPASGSLEGIRIAGADLQTADYIKVLSGSTNLFQVTSAGNLNVTGTATAGYVVSTNYAQASSLRIPSTANYHEIWNSTNELRIYANQNSVIRASTTDLYLDKNVTAAGNLTVAGIVTAQEFHTEFVSSSIVYESGSTQFGNSLDDNHRFTGSLFQSGSNVRFGGATPLVYFGDANTYFTNVGGNTFKLRVADGYDFTINNDSDTTRFKITDAGDVTLPGGELNVQGSGVSMFAGSLGVGATATNQVNLSSVTRALTINGSGATIIELATGGVRKANFYSNGTDASIANNANGKFDFLTNNNYRMTIAADGKLGLGTRTPEAIGLHIQKASTDTSINLDDKGHYHLVLQNNDAASTNAGRHSGIMMQVNSNSAAAEGTIYTEFEEDGGAKLHFTTTKSGTGQKRMAIDSDGNVGIGTVTPDALLHLYSANSAIKVETTNAANVAMVRFQTNGNDWYWAAGGSSQGYFPNKMYLYNESTGTNPITVTNDSKIGIGNNNRAPTYQLDNNGTARTTGIHYFENNIVSSPNWGRIGIAMGDLTTVPSATIHGKALKSAGATHANLRSTDTMGALLENTHNDANTGMKLGFLSTGTITGSSYIWGENTGTGGQGRMAFWTETGGALSERMRIEHNGNVGIGHTSPDAKLDLKGAGTANEELLRFSLDGDRDWSFAQESSGAGTGLRLRSLAGKDFYLDATSHIFRDQNGSNEVLRMVPSTNRVGIGTNSPQSKLHISENTNSNLEIEGSTAGVITVQSLNDARNAYEDLRLYGDNVNLNANASGKAGIGTHTPDGKLHIHTATAGSVTANTTYDDLVVENSTHAGISILTPNNAHGGILFGDPQDDDIGNIKYDHSTNKLMLTAGGSLGVTVTSTHTEFGGNVSGSATSTGSFGHLLVNGSSVSAGGGGGSSIWSVASNEAYYMNNVGIGTDNPDKQFHLHNGGHRPMIIKNTGDHNTFIEMDSNRSSADSHTGGISGKWNGTEVASIYLRTGADTTNKDDGYITFHTAPAGTHAERMRIASNGVVGIGTTAATNKFTVYGTGTANADAPVIQLNSGDGSHHWSGIRFSKAGTDKWGIVSDYAANDTKNLVVWEYESSAARMYFKTGGNVGIGNTNPSRKLDVTGDIGASTNIVAGTALYSNELITRSGNTLTFKTSGGTAISTFKNTGRVGIGETTPGTILHIKQNDTTGPTITLENSEYEAYINAWGSVGGGSGRQNRVEINATQTANKAFAVGADTIRFQIGGVGDSYEKMRIDSSGRIGIGTTSPSTYHTSADNLVVYESTNAGITIATSSTGTASIFFADSGTGDEAYKGRIEYSHGTNKLHFGANSVVNMTLDPLGNVGIGTATPTSTQGYSKFLDISGTTDTALILHSEVGGTANKWEIGNNTNGVLQFVHSIAGNGSTGIKTVIDASGNVGIGTTAPGSKLDIVGGNWNTSLTIKGGAGNSGIKFLDSDNNVDGYIYSSGGETGFLDPGGDWMFSVKDDTFIRFAIGGGAEKMRINSNGNVGIGETSPDELLHIKSATDAKPVIKLENSGNNVNSPQIQFLNSSTANDNDITGTIRFQIMNDASEGTEYGTIYGRAIDVSNGTEDGELHFRTISNGNLDTRLLLKSSYVGIGQTSPTHTLHVKSNDGLFLERGAGTYGLQVYADGAGSYLKASANDLQLWTGSTPSEKVRITQAGRVGIGTTSPVMALDIKAGEFEAAASSGTDTNGIARFGQSSGNGALDIGFHDTSGGYSWLQSRNVANYATRYSIVLQPTGGNVGIGTITPLSKLHVNGTASASMFHAVASSDAGSPEYSFADDPDTGMYWGGANVLAFSTAGAVRFTLNSGAFSSQTTGGARITPTNGSAAAATFTFNDDTDTGMYRAGANDIGFTTGGTERFRIDSSGNLIIRANDKHLYGLTSGNATISLIGVRGDNYVEIGHSGYGVVTGTGNWALDGSDNMTVNANAYFGEYLYHSGDTDTYMHLLDDRLILFAGGDNILDYEEDASSTLKLAGGGEADVTIGDATTFFIGGSQGSSDTKVGIGTATPMAKLDIRGANSIGPSNGNGGNHTVQVNDETTGAGAGVGGGIGFGGIFHATNNTYNTIFSEIRGIKENATSNNYASALTLHTRANGGNITEKLRIDSTGQVGIGTTVPGYELDVQKAGYSEIRAKATSAGRTRLHLDAYDDIAEIYFARTGANKGAIYQKGDGTNLNVWSFATNSEIMTFQYSNRYVGIMQTSPSYALDVNGTGRFVSDLRVEGVSYHPAVGDDIHLGNGLSTTPKIRFGTSSWLNNYGLESYWSVFSTNQNEGYRFKDSGGTELFRLQGSNSSGGAGVRSANFYGPVVPMTDNTANLGTASLRWANIYSADLHLSNVGSGGNEVDGTEGDWTIQEGEEELYLLNNKNGKKYKFVLQEIK